MCVHKKIMAHKNHGATQRSFPLAGVDPRLVANDLHGRLITETRARMNAEALAASNSTLIRNMMGELHDLRGTVESLHKTLDDAHKDVGRVLDINRKLQEERVEREAMLAYHSDFDGALAPPPFHPRTLHPSVTLSIVNTHTQTT